MVSKHNLLKIYFYIITLIKLNVNLKYFLKKYKKGVDFFKVMMYYIKRST